MELGKYLGMPVLHRRMNKETFSAVLESASSRLAGWKSHVLSLARRVTLTKAVLSSIPVRSMSSVMLPKSTLARIDKVSRAFLWGSTNEKKKQHLLSWKKVCNPKGEGGLGIRYALNMNKALIAKVGWRLLHDEQSLWARVLRKKYRVGDVHDRTWLVKKSNWSVVWSSVVTGLKEVIIPGLGWAVGDGRRIIFWRDKWLSGRALVDQTGVVVQEDQDTVLARDMWSSETGWRLELLSPYVSANTILELRAVVLDCVTGVKDRIAWCGSAGGTFSVKSAYALLTNADSPRPNMNLFFGRVWSVKVPERVRVFIWLVSHQVIMTNVERKRRHLCDFDVCSVCKGGFETIMHVLRDCPAILGIWNRIVPSRMRSEFFSRSLMGWLFENLKEGVVVDGVPWATTFAMAIWWSWKWRCGNVFGENGRCPDRVKFIKELSKEVWRANEKRAGQDRTSTREERQIGWNPPAGEWFKINTDGASRGNPGLATAGGVLRDSEGRWCGGFALNIGRCTAPLAELWGVYYGLYIAWAKQCSRVELEVDSELVVGFLRTGISETHPLSFMVRLCHGLLAKDWIFRISYVYREANCLADGLANYAFLLPLGFHSLESVPLDVVSMFEADELGSTRSRRVRM